MEQNNVIAGLLIVSLVVPSFIDLGFPTGVQGLRTCPIIQMDEQTSAQTGHGQRTQLIGAFYYVCRALILVTSSYVVLLKKGVADTQYALRHVLLRGPPYVVQSVT